MPYPTKPESADWLPSPSGQRSEMPPKSNAGGPTPAHPLGPYAPRSASGPSQKAGDAEWLPTTSGQYPHGKQFPGGGANSSPQLPAPKSAPEAKGGAGDSRWLPTESGQYAHGMNQDSRGDGGGRG